MIFAIDISALLDWKYLIVFLTGIAFGFLFMLLLYLYSVILSLKKKRKYKRDPVEIDELEIEMLIKDAQLQFKDKKLRNDVGLAEHLKTISLELSNDIAKIYYPTSKYPLLELSVDETLLLTNYITERINDFLKAKLLAPIKRRTVAQLKGIYDAKVKIEETKIVEVGKQVGAKKIGKTLIGVANALNPAYWVKKLAVDKLYDVIIVKISLAIIAIVGEETYKIYSKSVFKTPEELDIDIDKLYEEIMESEKQ